jgi:hypothetical protein
MKKFLFELPNDIELYDDENIKKLLSGEMTQIEFLKKLDGEIPATLKNGKLKIYTQKEIDAFFLREVKQYRNLSRV